MNSQPAPTGGDSNVREHLLALRHSILHLHKTLIESERAVYEQTFGKIESQNQFLQLLIKDPFRGDGHLAFQRLIHRHDQF